MKAGRGVFGGSAAGALVQHFVVVAAGVDAALEGVGVRLAGVKAVTGGDAVAVADKEGAVRRDKGASQREKQNRNDKSAANVHSKSVTAGIGARG